MFSVENFYHFFESHYGFDKTGVSAMIPKDGTKDLRDFVHMLDKDLVLEHGTRYHFNSTIKISILHDQEMFFALPTLITYRNHIASTKKTNADLGLEEIFCTHWGTCSWPIWCHSEINSPDIQWLERLGVIPCYYFYHGLIARDWFRHWKHHGGLDKMPQGRKYRFLLYARDHSGLREYRNTVVKELSPYQSHIKYHWNNLSLVNSDHSAKISVQDARECAIHLVAETVFDQRKIHLTEKIFKPMVMRQPFIVFAPPGSLEYLRSYGFRTFSEVWDESYDTESDHRLRMKKIIDLIAELATSSEQEFSRLNQKCQEIIDHNHRHFFSEKFETHLLDELHTNMSRSIERQRELIEIDPGGSLFWALDRIRRKGNYSEWGENLARYALAWFRENDTARFQAIIDQYPWARDFV